ncbi:UNVERIFIED_CONTAM: hypothetical protein Scaly_0623300 [Sesamum calycinum]|uniref:CRAL-TRIO domain-containing protein n=1 Tax=Sesamum calycinum TaxID=2727403 RepID=A0AAW2RSV7_9LAMI
MIANQYRSLWEGEEDRKSTNDVSGCHHYKKRKKMSAKNHRQMLQRSDDNIAQEAETGKVYRANYRDEYGRAVLVMRPGFQVEKFIKNTKAVEGQKSSTWYIAWRLRALLDLDEDVDQMVWLIDFEMWNTPCISMKATRETARLLQDLYPERIGIAILYNSPKVFESFWLLVKPFLELKTYKKIKFVYSDQPQSTKVMESLFDMYKLEPAFRGKSKEGFNYEAYAKRMKIKRSKNSIPRTPMMHYRPTR